LRALPAAIEAFERDQPPGVHGDTTVSRSRNAKAKPALNIEVLDIATENQLERVVGPSARHLL
jgi:hypothetical protein